MFEDDSVARFSGTQLCHAALWVGAVFLGGGLGNPGFSSLHQPSSESSGELSEVHLYLSHGK